MSREFQNQIQNQQLLPKKKSKNLYRDIFGSDSIFEDRKSLDTAIYKYFNGQKDVVESEYGPIEEWVFSSDITDFSNLFQGVTEVRNVDFSEWNTSDVVNMESMFENTFHGGSLLRSSAIEYSDGVIKGLNNWDVSNVINFRNMFKGSVVPDDISNWKLNRATLSAYENMFKDCDYKGVIPFFPLVPRNFVWRNEEEFFYSNFTSKPYAAKVMGLSSAKKFQPYMVKFEALLKTNSYLHPRNKNYWFMQIHGAMGDKALFKIPDNVTIVTHAACGALTTTITKNDFFKYMDDPESMVRGQTGMFSKHVKQYRNEYFDTVVNVLKDSDAANEDFFHGLALVGTNNPALKIEEDDVLFHKDYVSILNEHLVEYQSISFPKSKTVRLSQLINSISKSNLNTHHVVYVDSCHEFPDSSSQEITQIIKAYKTMPKSMPGRDPRRKKKAQESSEFIDTPITIKQKVLSQARSLAYDVLVKKRGGVEQFLNSIDRTFYKTSIPECAQGKTDVLINGEPYVIDVKITSSKRKDQFRLPLVVTVKIIKNTRVQTKLEARRMNGYEYDAEFIDMSSNLLLQEAASKQLSLCLSQIKKSTKYSLTHMVKRKIDTVKIHLLGNVFTDEELISLYNDVKITNRQLRY